jgi:hypothetical protein
MVDPMDRLDKGAANMIVTKGTRRVGEEIVDTREVYIGTRLATHGEMAKRIAELEAALRGVLEHWEPTRDDYRLDRKGDAQFDAAFRVWSVAQATIASSVQTNKDRK